MIKSTFHYFKTEEKKDANSNLNSKIKPNQNNKSKKTKYLYKEFSKSYKGFLHNNILWSMWFKIDLSELDKNENNSYLDDDFYFGKFLELYTKMKNLNLDLDWICNIITYTSQNYMKDCNNIESLINIVKKQYKQDMEKS